LHFIHIIIKIVNNIIISANIIMTNQIGFFYELLFNSKEKSKINNYFTNDFKLILKIRFTFCQTTLL